MIITAGTDAMQEKGTNVMKDGNTGIITIPITDIGKIKGA